MVRGSNPGGGEIFRTYSDRPWGPPSLLYNTHPVFPGGKERPGRDADPSTPSSAVCHERVELHLYSPYGPYGLYRVSVPVQGCTLPLSKKHKSTCIDLLKMVYRLRKWNVTSNCHFDTPIWSTFSKTEEMCSAQETGPRYVYWDVQFWIQLSFSLTNLRKIINP